MTEADKIKVASAFADPKVKEAVAILREHNAHARKTFALTDQVVSWVRKNVWRDLS